MYDLPTLNELGIRQGQRVASVDLDAVIVGDMREIFLRQGRFVGWSVPGLYHPRVFNGSFSMFNAGDLSELWDHFDPATSPKKANDARYYGSDQGWQSLHLAKRDDVEGWQWPQMASYPREVKRMGKVDIRNRIIFFHGRQKPWHADVLRYASWIKRYYFQEELEHAQG